MKAEKEYTEEVYRLFHVLPKIRVYFIKKKKIVKKLATSFALLRTCKGI